jgi:hypothetical protein
MPDDDGAVNDHRAPHHPPFSHAAQMVHAFQVLGHVVGVHCGEVGALLVFSLVVAATSLAAHMLLLYAVPGQAWISRDGGPDWICRACSHLHTHHLS